MSDDKFYEELRTKKNQAFLYSLYSLSGDKTTRLQRYQILNSAKSAQLSILIKVLKRLLNHTIWLPKHLQSEIKQTRIVPHLDKHFYSKEGYRTIKCAGVEYQRTVLKKITCYHLLLSSLFQRHFVDDTSDVSS